MAAMSTQLFAPLDSAGNVLLLVLHLSLAASATALNALCIAALLRARLLLQRNRFLYVLNTCVSDLCGGVSWFYAGVFDVSDADGRLDTCFVQPSFIGVSCLSVMCAQLDRYYAVKSPFAYVRRVTRRKTLAAIALCWLVVLLPIVLFNAAPRSSSSAYQSVSTMLANVAMFAIMGGMNVKLCLIARSHAKRAGEQSGGRDAGARSSYSVIVVAMVAMVLWSPSYIGLVVCVVAKVCVSIQNYGLNPITILRTLTTVTTPAINFVCSKALRKSVASLVPRCCSSNSRVDVDESGQSAVVINPRNA